MLRCSLCGRALQTLDLPCPECEADLLAPDADGALHEYSKTFTTRWAFRPDPDRFVATLNQWLYEQPGLVHVAPVLHRGVDQVSGATLVCTASLEPTPHIFQFDRVPLLKRSLLPGGRTDLATALNEWNDAHPYHERVWAIVHEGGANGLPVECWILSTVDRRFAQPPSIPSERGGFMGVQRLPAALLFPIFLLIALVGLGSGEKIPLLNHVIFVAIAVGLGWLTVRFPPWRRRTRA